ncbi:hypothetical protein MRX96_059391 [Rhipicephalus microplus]
MATDADEDDNGTPTNITGNRFVNTTTPKTYQFTAKAKTPTRASMIAVARGLEAQHEEELESESNEEEDDSASVISVATTNNGDRTKPLGYGSFSKKISRNARAIKKWGKSFEGIEQRILTKCTQVIQQQLAQMIQLQIEQALERALSPEKLQPLIGIAHVKHQQFLGSRDTAIELCVTELAISGKGRGTRGARKKKTSTTVFIANIYSNPRHGKQKFKTLFHKIKSTTSQAQKDLAKRGDAAAVICGDFNAQHRELGYTTTTSKGRNLLEDAGEAEFTLLINPAHPSRIGTSVARDTNPDLTFAMLPEGGTAKWRNTGINLGSDHFIIEIELPLAHLNGNPNRDKTIKHKLVDWSKFRNTKLGEVDNIDEWSAKLLAATEGATEEIDAPEEIETMDPRLAHLLEARRSLQKRWRRQRHNRKLRNKIAELGREIERHSRQLCSRRWFALCSQADGQLHRDGTWKLLRQLMDETKSCEYQPAGRGLLDRVGLLPPGERPGAGPDGELEKQVPLSDEAARKIIVYPLPKNMDPERDAGRRAARAVALARQHQRDEGAVYVDAARYSGRRNAFAAVVVSATTGKLLTASTVHARTAGQAEEAVIALATGTLLGTEEELSLYPAKLMSLLIPSCEHAGFGGLGLSFKESYSGAVPECPGSACGVT